MKLKFFLRKSGAIKVNLSGPPVPVAGNGRRRLQLSVFKSQGIKVKPEDWDAAKERVKRSDKSHKHINGLLSDVEEKIWDLVDNSDSPELSRQDFEGVISGNVHARGFWGVMGEYLEFVKDNKANRTYINTQSVYKKLKQFSEDTGYNLSFSSCTTNFFDKFVSYMRSEGLQNSSIKVRLATVSGFLSWAKDRGHEVPDFKPPKIRQIQKTHITLTRQEVNTLESMSLNPKKAKVRDLFLFCVYTSMRFGDTQKLSDKNLITISGKPCIEYRPTKTKGQTLYFEIDSKIREILDRYRKEFFLLPRISQTHFNLTLKMIAIEAGFTDPVKIEKMVGNKIVIEEVRKYELIASHTARRTAVTLWLEEGYPYEWVMRRTGHKSYAMLEKYASKSKEAQIRFLHEGKERVRKINEGKG